MLAFFPSRLTAVNIKSHTLNYLAKLFAVAALSSFPNKFCHHFSKQKVTPVMPNSRTNNSSNSKTSVFEGKTAAVFEHKGYKVENKLGQGAFGVVYKATNREGQLAAVKVIDLTKMSDRSREKYLPREIKTLIDCRHENLIQVYDIFRADKKMVSK